MAAYTLAEAQAELATVKEQLRKAGDAQSYSHNSPTGGRSHQRAFYAELRKRHDQLVNLVDTLERGGIRHRRGVFV